MPFFDLPLEQLQSYMPPRTEAPDFDVFWAATLVETRQHPLNATFTHADFGLKLVDTYDVTFNGYGGQPIKGWLTIPKGASDPLPCVVQFIGYGGGRGFPYNWLQFPSMGYAHFVMDTRGQGSSWQHGDTPDLEMDGGNPQFPGFMTRGILAPNAYYYRRVYTDAVRAVEAARSHAFVDAARVAVTGSSQGGGITIAVAGLVPDIAAAMPDVPFLSHFYRAVTTVDTAPYNEIRRFLAVHRDKNKRVFETLSYFDGMNLAARAKAPALFSVGLMDDICPPSTVYAAFNNYGGQKQIAVYDFNNHEGGQSHHLLEQASFLRALWG